MSKHAHSERILLVDLLEKIGPDAPTLCEGWTTRDLAAHLVVRERRIDASGGLMIKSLAPRLERVQGQYAAKPFPELLSLIRSGPPKLSPFGLPGADEAANTVEYYVHHEDVLRAQPGWEPRVVSAELADALWKRLGQSAKLSGRHSPTGLVLRRPDGQTVVARKGEPVVTVTGEPGELVLFSTGRQDKATVELDGTPEDVAKVRSAKLGI